MPLWPALWANVAVALTFMLIPPLVPPLVDWFGVDPGVGGWTSSAVNLAFAVVSYRLGRRGVSVRSGLLGGLAVQAVANLVAIWAPSFGWYLVSRGAAGLGMGLAYGAGLGLVAAGFDVARRSAWFAAMLPATAIIVPAGGVITDRAGWQAAHALMAALPAVVVAVLVVRPFGSPARPQAPVRGFGFSTTAWVGIGSVVLFAVGSGGAWVFIGEYARQALGGGASLSATAVSLNGLTGFFGAALAGRLTYAARPWAGLAVLAASGTSVLWALQAGTAVSYLAGISVWALFFWASYAIYQGMLAESVGAEATGRILAFFQVPYSIGIAIGPIAGGLMLDATGFLGLAVFSMVAVLAGLAVFAAAWGRRLVPQSAPGPA